MQLFAQSQCALSDTVRIALHLKGIDYDVLPIEHINQHFSKPLQVHQVIASQHITPVIHDHNRIYIQSHAILEYLDEAYPDPPLLIGMARDRIQTRALMEVITTDMQPLTSIRAEQYFMNRHNDFDVSGWKAHWLKQGFDLLEVLLCDNPATGKFCHGDTVTLADIYLAPQIWIAQSEDIDLDEYPTVMRIYEECMQLNAFANVALDVDYEAR
jgi:maleylacetoacetate isomerase